jgi:hypothetical protein
VTAALLYFPVLVQFIRIWVDEQWLANRCVRGPAVFARVGLPRILTGVRMESWIARIRLILKARLSLGHSMGQARTGASEELLVVNRAHIRFARVFMCLCRSITRWVDIMFGRSEMCSSRVPLIVRELMIRRIKS